MHSKGGRARARDVLLRSAEIVGLDIVISHLGECAAILASLQTFDSSPSEVITRRSCQRQSSVSGIWCGRPRGKGRPLANPVRGEGMTGNAKGVRFCFSSASDVWRIGYIL